MTRNTLDGCVLLLLLGISALIALLAMYGAWTLLMQVIR